MATYPTSCAAIEWPLATEGRAISELDDIDLLVKTYRARLLRFVTFSTGDPDLAETITQDCLLKAYNARDRFRGDCSISTWLTSIAVNLIRDQQRLQKFRFWRQARATAIDVTECTITAANVTIAVDAHIGFVQPHCIFTSTIATLADRC